MKNYKIGWDEDMKRALIISQKISDVHMDILKGALPSDSVVDLITGSQMERHTFIEAPPHDPVSVKSRLICWYKFYRFVMKWAKRQKNTYDLIFATSNPPVNGLLGVRLKKRLGGKFVYMNWDLYPQVIETSMHGLIPTVFSRFWHWLNNRIYPKVDQMVTIGAEMGKTINAPLKKEISVDVIPMFTDAERMRPIPKCENRFCQENDLADKFVVLYSGKMGLGHNLEILLEASELLKDIFDLCFVFIGHGQKYEMVKEWIRVKNSTNVMLFPLQSEEMFPLSMACGDVGFISQEKEAAKCFMPAKTYDMMACGMAVIAYSEGTDDLSCLVREGGFGVTITENKPVLLARKIRDIYTNRDLLNEYSKKARELAENRFDKKPVTAQYRAVFDKTLM